MSHDDLLRNFFRTAAPPIPEVLMDERTDLLAAMDEGEEPLPAPLLADAPPEGEHWRGYVLVNVNTNVEAVCEQVKARLGLHFRGMSLVTGIYDLIVRVEAANKAQFKETLILVRETPGVIQSVTLLDLNG